MKSKPRYYIVASKESSKGGFAHTKKEALKLAKAIKETTGKDAEIKYFPSSTVS